MAQVIADRRDVDFVLHEQFQVGDLSKHEMFADFNKKVVDMVITEARNLAMKEILPTQKIGDEVGCKYANNEVTTPEEYKRAWELLAEGEWMALSRDPEVGGQGMPETLAQAATNYFTGGNMALMLFVSLTHGAARLIENFGSEEQKQEAVDVFLKFLRQPKGHASPGHEQAYLKTVKLIPGFGNKLLYTIGDFFPNGRMAGVGSNADRVH